ncbi:hypothetical protein, partial [Stenotrophomonas maltophilia]|uniref:hypothetical protein n=1 Tax=Stenotrophomonas maltophilia TaxID=40324 RepID=UPI001EF78396
VELGGRAAGVGHGELVRAGIELCGVDVARGVGGRDRDGAGVGSAAAGRLAAPAGGQQGEGGGSGRDE